jgi:hypothetical protein
MSEGGFLSADPLSRTVDRMEMHARAYVRCLLAMLDVSGDRFVGELGDEVCLPVIRHHSGSYILDLISRPARWSSDAAYGASQDPRAELSYLVRWADRTSIWEMSGDIITQTTR